MNITIIKYKIRDQMFKSAFHVNKKKKLKQYNQYKKSVAIRLNPWPSAFHLNTIKTSQKNKIWTYKTN